VTLAAKNRQEIKEMEALAEERRRARNLARLDWVPDLQTGFEYTWVGDEGSGAPRAGEDSWMFPLRINVPLWPNRRIPALQAAAAELEAARAKLLGAQNETFYEVKDAYVRFNTASKIAALYEAAVIPQAEIALKSDQAGYEAGEVDVLNLLDSERIYLNARLTHIKVVAEALRGFADLERATGAALTEV
jgi:cobalt-zinc-cadmium efflux system outer membrane protein